MQTVSEALPSDGEGRALTLLPGHFSYRGGVGTTLIRHDGATVYFQPGDDENAFWEDWYAATAQPKRRRLRAQYDACANYF